MYNTPFFKNAMDGKNSLDLSGLLIGDCGAICLANALIHNSSVNWLDLQYNRITSEGAIALAEAWKCNKTLTDIYLNGNIIGHEGLKAISASLRSNKSIQRIFGVFLRKAAALEFSLKENFTYEPGNSTLLKKIREKMDKFRLRHEFLALKHLADTGRLSNRPCRVDSLKQCVVELTLSLSDLPFSIVVSYLSS